MWGLIESHPPRILMKGGACSMHATQIFESNENNPLKAEKATAIAAKSCILFNDVDGCYILSDTI